MNHSKTLLGKSGNRVRRPLGDTDQWKRAPRTAHIRKGEANFGQENPLGTHISLGRRRGWRHRRRRTDLSPAATLSLPSPNCQTSGTQESELTGLGRALPDLIPTGNLGYGSPSRPRHSARDMNMHVDATRPAGRPARSGTQTNTQPKADKLSFRRLYAN